MERRQSPRHPTDFQTTLTLLGEEVEVNLPVRVLDLSGQGARVLVGRRLALGACVKLSLEDCLYLGEVAYCSQSDEQFQAGIALEHSIRSLSDLERLRRSLADNSVTPRQDCESRPGWRSTARR